MGRRSKRLLANAPFNWIDLSLSKTGQPHPIEGGKSETAEIRDSNRRHDFVGAAPRNRSKGIAAGAAFFTVLQTLALPHKFCG